MKTTSQRFWEKVRKTKKCWLWEGAKSRSGYGNFYIGKIATRKSGFKCAHRYAYIESKGPIPKEKEIHHKCNDPACVNPSHLIAVTRQEHLVNLTPGSVSYKAARATHCPKGHPYDKSNTRMFKGKYRRCKTCERLLKRQQFKRRYGVDLAYTERRRKIVMASYYKRKLANIRPQECR